jgi:transposase
VNKYAKKPRKAYVRLTLDEKLEVVLGVLENGRKRKEMALEKNVSLNSVNIWIRNYQLYGRDGLSNKRTAYVAQEETQKELKRLKKIEKRYNEQLEEIEILKKFQAFLKENE